MKNTSLFSLFQLSHLVHKPEGTRRVGRPASRWLDSIEEDLKIMGVRNWRRKSLDRGQWKSNRKKGQGSSWTVAPEEGRTCH
jgi:hypothetical protein